MAAPVNTVSTIGMIGIKEDVADVIYNIDPDETPLFSSLSKTSISNTYTEWLTDTLRAAADNAHVEGDDSTAESRAVQSRVGNYAQIFKNTVQTSGTEGAVDKYGRAKQMAYELVKVGKEQKLDIERALFLNRARDAGSSVTPRYLAGLGAWIKTNVGTVGAGGANPTGNGTDTRTDGSTSAFSQTRLDAVLKLIWDNGGTPGTIYLSSANMGVALGFTGNNGQQSMVQADSGKVIKDLVLYRTPYGTVDFQMSRLMRSRDVYVIDKSMLAIGQLRPMKQEDLAKTGDNDKRHLITELTLINKNEKAHGLVPDNS